MIRYIAIAALVSVLGIVLYIPSAVPPEKILDVLHQEHERVARTWGEATADRILARTLEMQSAGAAISTPPEAITSAQKGPLDSAVVSQVANMSTRLFGNPYFRSIDSLFVLVTYRLSTLVEIAPLLLVFLLAVGVDGAALRQVRAKEFMPHSAEAFAASVAGGIILACVGVVSCFVPVGLSPVFLLATFLSMLFLLGRAIANYHLIR